MPSYEIVDPSSGRAQTRRHVFWRLGGPVLGVVSVIAAIGATAIHSYTSSRDGALALSRELLTSQQNYITQSVTDYLAPAKAGVIIAHDLLHAAPVDDAPRMFADFAISTLQHVPQAASLYLADGHGAFWLIERNRDGSPGWETTHLQRDGTTAAFQHWFYDPQGTLLRETRTPASDFDPTREVWFQGAANQPGVAHGDDHLFWSKPYPFPPTHQPIVTSSLAYKQPDGTVTVLAMNILLEQMSGFLDQMTIGKSGKAVIADREGQVIAGPGMPTHADPAGWDAGRLRIDPDTQPVFTRALSMYRVYGPGSWGMTIRGERYVAIAADVPLTNGSRWVLMLNAPARDFAGFAISARRWTLFYSLVVIALACVLAVFLIRQERKTDLVQGRLDTMKAQTARRREALRRVIAAHDLFDPSHDIPVLTEVLAEITGARRASIWQLLDDGARLVCDDSFDVEHDAHGAGMEVAGPEFSRLLERLHGGQSVEAARAQDDEATRGFYRVVMRPAGFVRLDIEPAIGAGATLGAIVLEDARDASSAEAFTRVISDLVALRLTAARMLGERREGMAAEIGHLPEETAPLRFGDEFLLVPGGSGSDDAHPSGRYPMVPVLMLTFDAPDELYAADPRWMLPMVRRIVGRVQDIARAQKLFAVRLVAGRLLVIGSCGREPDFDAVVRLADAALAIREACLTMLADSEADPMFRMGIDVGPAFGDHLGREPDVFNVWGEAVTGAELMAEAAPQPGTIQVSEAAYAVLRSYYLFRPRGMFYRPGPGVTRSFVLAGRR